MQVFSTKIGSLNQVKNFLISVRKSVIEAFPVKEQDNSMRIQYPVL
jgi:hypothetical protein